MLFLAVLGGAALLEVHRSRQPGAKEVRRLKRSQEDLISQLKETQSELLAVRQQKLDIDEELSKLSAHSIALEQNCSTLGQEKAELESMNAELQDRTARLLERQSLLEQTAESLKLENGTLLQQFDRLRIAHDSETAAFHEQLSSLKDRVLEALGQFASGDLSAEQLVACLSASGVTLRTPGQPGDEEDGSLTARLDSARGREERLRSLRHMELKVGDDWAHQVRLVSGDASRALRLMTTAHKTLETSRIPAPPTRKLATPPKLKDVPQSLLPEAPATDKPCNDPETAALPKSITQVPTSDENACGNAAPEPAAAKLAAKRSFGLKPIKRGSKAGLMPTGKKGVPLLSLDKVGVDESIDVGMAGPSSIMAL